MAADPNGRALDPAPAAPPPGATIELPRFNVFAARKAGPQIRPATDRTADFATVGDVHNVAQYAASVAVQVVNAAQGIQAENFQARLNHELRELALETGRAIAHRIREYDDRRREQVWYRRAWRWVAGKHSAVDAAASTETPA